MNGKARDDSWGQERKGGKHIYVFSIHTQNEMREFKFCLITHGFCLIIVCLCNAFCSLVGYFAYFKSLQILAIPII